MIAPTPPATDQAKAATAPSDSASGPLDYISASRLNCFQECRLKFYFRYVERIPTQASPALFVGKAVHHVLQRWNLSRWRGLPADADSLEPAFAEYWESRQPEEGIRWGAKEADEREKAWGMLRHYLGHTPIPLEEKPEAVEVVVERDLSYDGLPPLRGVIDLVRAGGRIVDFKTTARTPDDALAAHLHGVQLGVYALLYRGATGHPESGFELQFLVKTKEPKLAVTALSPATPDQTRRLVRIMGSYVAGVGAGDFVPSPGLQCSYCEYLNECQSWR